MLIASMSVAAISLVLCVVFATKYYSKVHEFEAAEVAVDVLKNKVADLEIELTSERRLQRKWRAYAYKLGKSAEQYDLEDDSNES